MEQKKITKVQQLMSGHLALDLEDGSTQIVHRGNHEAHDPKVGDMWPPEPERTDEKIIREDYIAPALEAAEQQPDPVESIPQAPKDEDNAAE
jgi:hypothetical protein